jgi:uncharacterized protein with FMN-binding domain
VSLNSDHVTFFSQRASFFPDRVIYARKGGDDIVGGATSVENGDKITLDQASVSSSPTIAQHS